MNKNTPQRDSIPASQHYCLAASLPPVLLWIDPISSHLNNGGIVSPSATELRIDNGPEMGLWLVLVYSLFNGVGQDHLISFLANRKSWPHIAKKLKRNWYELIQAALKHLRRFSQWLEAARKSTEKLCQHWVTSIATCSNFSWRPERLLVRLGTALGSHVMMTCEAVTT